MEEKDKCQAIHNVFKLIKACQLSFKHQTEPLYFTIDKTSKYTWPVEYLHFNDYGDKQTIVVILNKNIKSDEPRLLQTDIERLQYICNKTHIYDKTPRTGVYVFDFDCMIDARKAFSDFHYNLMNTFTVKPFINFLREEVCQTCFSKVSENINPLQFIGIQCEEFLKQSTSIVYRGYEYYITSMVFGFQNADWFTWPIKFFKSLSMELDEDNKWALKEYSAGFKLLDEVKMKTYEVLHRDLRDEKKSDIPKLMVIRNPAENDAQGSGLNFMLERTACIRGLNVFIATKGGFLVKTVAIADGVYDFYSTYEHFYVKNPGDIPSDQELTNELLHHLVKFIDPR